VSQTGQERFEELRLRLGAFKKYTESISAEKQE
jgi:hypothetical protein